MGGLNKCNLLFFLVFFFILQKNQSLGWFFSSKDDTKQTDNEKYAISWDSNSEFSMEVPDNRKRIELTENAKRKIDLKVSCWNNAYQNLFSTCKESLIDEEKRSRFAWDLTDCFQKDSGQQPFPRCDRSSPMLKCRKQLDSDTNKIFLEFYLEANHICHQLQSEAFSRQTERLVNELKASAQFSRDKLYDIATKQEDVLKNTHQVQDSLDSIDDRTKQLGESILNVEDRIDLVLKHSRKIYEQSQGIADSQLELQESQTTMKASIEATMENVEKSQHEVIQEILDLKSQTVQIQKEIVKLTDTVFTKMTALQNKADEIKIMAGVSLDKQKQLLVEQNLASEGIQFLTQFQSQALEESRGSLQKLAKLGSQQQEELLARQEQLQQAHDRLTESSKTILAAQENFESKQANMFVILNQLFAMHNACLLESRGLKAIFVYTLSIFVIYMLTSTKQTYGVRHRLYIGLCTAFLVEFAMIRCVTVDIEQQAWIASVVRSLMVILISGQLIYSIYAYRDYEVLNHHMLLKLHDTLNEKLHDMKLHDMRRKDGDLWETDDDIDWSTWVDTDVIEELNHYEDPDYIIPEEIEENSFSSSLTTNKYNLRSQRYISY